MRTIGEIAELLDVDRGTIKWWIGEFGDFISEYASPQSGRTRLFTEADTRVLALIGHYWDEQPDLEHIHVLLNSGEQDDEHFYEFVHLHTPIFQDVPDDLDETCSHGVLLNSMYNRPAIEVARAYKYAADELVKEAIGCQEPHLLDYPVFFTYRHSLELYLKLALDDPEQAKEIKHDLTALVRAVEKKLGGKISEWTRSRLQEFSEIDPASDLFRYADRAPEHPRYVEMWIDFCQLRTVMEQLCEAFEAYLRNPKAPLASVTSENG